MVRPQGPRTVDVGSSSSLWRVGGVGTCTHSAEALLRTYGSRVLQLPVVTLPEIRHVGTLVPDVCLVSAWMRVA